MVQYVEKESTDSLFYFIAPIARSLSAVRLWVVSRTVLANKLTELYFTLHHSCYHPAFVDFSTRLIARLRMQLMINFLPSLLADMFRAPYDPLHETNPMPRITQHHRYPLSRPLHRFRHHLRSSSSIFPTTQLNAPFIWDTLRLQAAIHHHFVAHPSIPSGL